MYIAAPKTNWNQIPTFFEIAVVVARRCVKMAKHKARKRSAQRQQPVQQPEPAAKAGDAAYKAAKVLELPLDLVAGTAHLEFSGNREVIIEGCRGILEYDEDIVCIDAGKMTVRFMGRGLELRNFTDHSAIINGFILSVEFLS